MNFFKYFSPRSADCFLKFETITYSKPSSYNDPFEFHPNIKRIKGPEIKSINIKINIDSDPKGIKYYQLETDSDAHETVDNKLLESVSSKIVTTCFSASESEVPVNILMWSHYADSHKGIAIKLKNGTKFSASLKPILYVNKQPIFDLLKIESEQQISLSDFYFKYDAWLYESEYRHARMISECKPIPGCENIYSYPLAHEHIDFIVVGLNATESLKELAIQYSVKNMIPICFIKKSINGFGFELMSGSVPSIEFGMLLKKSFEYEAAKSITKI